MNDIDYEFHDFVRKELGLVDGDYLLKEHWDAFMKHKEKNKGLNSNHESESIRCKTDDSSKNSKTISFDSSSFKHQLSNDVISSKLKTLKEIIYPGDTAIRLNDLKQEAIKWIKDIRENLDDNIPSKCKDTIGLICWIKHFFNITDEDLK